MARLIFIVTLLGGCADADPSVVVRVRSDLLAGLEVDAVRTVVDRERVAEVPIDDSLDLLEGVRVARLRHPPGEAEIVVSLLEASRIVAVRTVLVEVIDDTTVSVLITRECRDVECPTGVSTCIAGACADPRCRLEAPASCPSVCEVDDDCFRDSPCSVGACERGRCVSVQTPEYCPEGSTCHPEEGCLVGAEAPPRVEGVRFAVSSDVLPPFELEVGSGEQLRPIPFTLHALWPVLPDRVVGSTCRLIGVRRERPLGPDGCGFVSLGGDGILDDRYLYVLESGTEGGRFRSRSGIALDGEWVNPATVDATEGSTFPSGDGRAGGDFELRFDVLRADVDGDGEVGERDRARVEALLGARITGAGWDARADLDRNGVIGTDDLRIVEAHVGNHLPEGEPTR